MSLTIFFALSKCNVQRLGDDDTSVHLRHGLGGLFRRGETDESESLGATVLDHDASGGDGSEVGELFAELLIVDGVVQVLDEKVDALVTVHALHLDHLELALQLGLDKRKLRFFKCSICALPFLRK